MPLSEELNQFLLNPEDTLSFVLLLVLLSIGFGPVNYSTALPDRQDRAVSDTEELLSQSTKRGQVLTTLE